MKISCVIRIRILDIRNLCKPMRNQSTFSLFVALFLCKLQARWKHVKSTSISSEWILHAKCLPHTSRTSDTPNEKMHLRKHPVSSPLPALCIDASPTTNPQYNQAHPTNRYKRQPNLHCRMNETNAHRRWEIIGHYKTPTSITSTTQHPWTSIWSLHIHRMRTETACKATKHRSKGIHSMTESVAQSMQSEFLKWAWKMQRCIQHTMLQTKWSIMHSYVKTVLVKIILRAGEHAWNVSIYNHNKTHLPEEC